MGYVGTTSEVKKCNLIDILEHIYMRPGFFVIRIRFLDGWIWVSNKLWPELSEHRIQIHPQILKKNVYIFFHSKFDFYYSFFNPNTCNPSLRFAPV